MKKLPVWNKLIFLQIMLEDKTHFNPDNLIDEVLRTELEFSLPDNFADSLAENIGRRFAWEQYIKEFLIYLAVIVGIVVVTAVMTYIWYNNNLSEWLEFIGKNAITIIGINLVVVFILFADRVLLRYFMYRGSIK